MEYDERDMPSEIHSLKRLVDKSVQNMGLDGFMEKYCSFAGLTATEIWFKLELFEAPRLVVGGLWRDNPDIDVYDVVLRYAESNFSRIRQEKFESGPLAGCFAVIMADPLSDSWRAEEEGESIEK